MIHSLAEYDIMYQTNPSYSPELNPIELFFNHLKENIRIKGKTSKYINKKYYI